MTDMFTAILIITICFLCVTIIDVCTRRIVERNMKIGCITVCVTIAVSLICEWLGVWTDGADVALIPLHRAVKLIEFCCSPFISVAAAYGYGRVKWTKFVFFVAFMHVLFQIIMLNTPYMFMIDSENIYHRSKFYFIYVVVFSFSVLYCFACILCEELKNYRVPDVVLLATLVFLVVGISIQMIQSNLRVEYLCVAVGNYLLYNCRCNSIFQMDGLTCLLNRRCYEKDIDRIASPAVIINMDVNKFKFINDTYGHTAGDYYLKEVARIIRKNYGKHGSCYRVGGDEFCVVVQKNLKDLKALNESFQRDINEFRAADGKAPVVAVGYAYYDKNETHIKRAVEMADEMMYQNKNGMQ